jgi:hypothetical protein
MTWDEICALYRDVMELSKGYMKFPVDNKYANAYYAYHAARSKWNKSNPKCKWDDNGCTLATGERYVYK